MAIGSARPMHSARVVRQPKAQVSVNDLAITTSNTYVTLPDVKRPGKLAAKCWVSGFSFTESGGYLGRIRALFFENGFASVTMTAPEAKIDITSRRVVATGGVLIRSLRQSNTYLRCDRMIWTPKNNQVIADGHVFYHTSSGATLVTPRLIGDTALKSLRSDIGGKAIFPKGW